MKKKVLMILGVMVLIIASVFLTSCTLIPVASREDQHDGSTHTAAPTAAATKEAQSENQYNVGDTASLKNWEINVIDMQIVDSINMEFSHFSPKEEGNKFIQISLSISNLGKRSDTFLPYVQYGDSVRARIKFKNDYEFTATNLLGYENDLHNSTINPLSSRTGEIVFEIPSAVADSADELILEFISGREIVKFKLR